MMQVGNMNLKWINLTPAYGRDYTSEEAVINDFYGGRDFRLNTPLGSTYCSIRDIPKGTKIQFRYSKLEETFVITKL